MSHRLSAYANRSQPVHACRDVCAPDCEDPALSSSERDLVKEQAGNALIALGAMFAESPLFREHIETSTAQMLVLLGKKLKRK